MWQQSSSKTLSMGALLCVKREFIKREQGTDTRSNHDSESELGGEDASNDKRARRRQVSCATAVGRSSLESSFSSDWSLVLFVHDK